MLFVVDLNSLELIQAATDRSPVVSVQGKRGDNTPFEVIFVRNGIAEELEVSTVLTFGAKQAGKYDAAAVVLSSNFTLSGTGTSAKYLGSPSFNTTELNALFLIDSNDANDPAYIDLMAEFTWQVGSGAPSSTKTFAFRVHNDVVRDSELSPTALPTPIGDTEPSNGAISSVTINPTGADNSVTYTSIDYGRNDITVTYATPAAQATTTVGVVGAAITVTPGTKARMIVTGTLTSDGSTPVVFSNPLPYTEISNGKPVYEILAEAAVIWNGTQWILSHDSGGQWTSTDAVSTPDLVTTWVPQFGSTGTPVVTAGTSSAAQVIAAVNDSVDANALVIASASGTVTGAVAAVAATNLAGGVSQTLTPPYLRVAGGFLYVPEAGIWKKTALSAL